MCKGTTIDVCMRNVYIFIIFLARKASAGSHKNVGKLSLWSAIVNFGLGKNVVLVDGVRTPFLVAGTE